MKHLARLTVIVSTFVTTMALSATAALAYAPPPAPSTRGTETIPAPVVIHTTSSSGVSAWTVLLIAVGAVLVGVALDELRRAISRHHHAHNLATA
jgi:hypothetical protein